MLSHVYLGVNDFERAFAFYAPLMNVLGLTLRFRDDARPWAGWQSPDAPRPLFLVGMPCDGQAAAPGNGPMALAQGGTCEGPPGLRPHYHPDYHPNYHGAYVRDPDGNKLCVCCHTPPSC